MSKLSPLQKLSHSNAITRSRDAKEFDQNQKAARDGGKIAGNARRELEKETGKKVISKSNYLGLLKELTENER